jgi:hypothetical protein
VVSSEVDLAEPKYQKVGSYDVLECLNIDLMVFVDAWNLVTLILFNIGAIWWRYIFDIG